MIAASVVHAAIDYVKAVGKQPLPSPDRAGFYYRDLRDKEKTLREAAQTAYRHGWGHHPESALTKDGQVRQRGAPAKHSRLTNSKRPKP